MKKIMIEKKEKTKVLKNVNKDFDEVCKLIYDAVQSKKYTASQLFDLKIKKQDLMIQVLNEQLREFGKFNFFIGFEHKCQNCNGLGVLLRLKEIKETFCSDCKGSGILNNKPFICQTCKGTGEIILHGKKIPCPKCKGIGMIEYHCQKCKGTGKIKLKKPYKQIWKRNKCQCCNGYGVIISEPKFNPVIKNYPAKIVAPPSSKNQIIQQI
jgi:DnaJ-class molecular chaperone